MALKPSCRFPRSFAHPRSTLLLAMLVVAAPLVATPSHAEDSRIEKAKKVRDEILEKRRLQPAGAAPRPDLQPAADPLQASIAAARERLAAIDLQIEDKRRQGAAMAAPRDKLQAKSDELGLEINAIQEQNRARVEAIYRSAKLGAGAAGWHPEPARSARLSRYLASVAAVQQKKLEVVEIEHGSVIASLDKARAEDASAQNELRALDADRAEALASLDRAMAEAGAPRVPDLSPEDAEAEALAQEHAAALAQDPPVAAGGVAEDASDSAAAVERAMALLEARTGAKAPACGAAGDGAATANGEFAWPPSSPGAPPSEAEAKALAEAKAALDARTAQAGSADDAAKKAAEEAAKKAAEEAEAQAAEEKAAAEAKAAEAKVIAEAKAAAKAAEEAKAAKAAEEKAAAEAAALAKAKEAKEKAEAHGTSGELDDGPAVLAPSSPPTGEQVASATAQTSGAPAAATNADAAPAEEPKRPNLFSRMFGGDRESDAFAASRGSLPPPVAGKVVANYGQQHKSGATYRGVILRAGHSAPIKAVAGGKVSFAGNVPGLGNTIIVSHGGRYHTVYARLGTLEVKEGQSVGSGTEIGTLPDDNADMHFELRDQGKAIDPVPWLKGGVPGAAQ